MKRWSIKLKLTCLYGGFMILLIVAALAILFSLSNQEVLSSVQSDLREQVQGATVILISHRITTLMQADRILVLEDGRVADIGTHSELISRPGAYRDIYDIQMSSDDRRLMEEGGEA